MKKRKTKSSSKKEKSEALNFDVLFEAIDSPLLILDKDFNIVAANAARVAATGVTIEQTFGRNIFEVFPDSPNDPNANGVANLSASLNRVLQNKAADRMAIQKYDIPIPDSKTGEFEERYWSPINVPLINSKGEVTHILHRVDDVTEEVTGKRRESVMAESEARAREVANKLPIIVWTARPDSYVDWYNDWWYEYLEVPRGTGWDDPKYLPMHPDDLAITNVLWPRAVAAGKAFNMEQRFRRGSDGQYRWHLVRGVPVFDENGNVKKYVAGNTDIHDEKMLAEDLKMARLAAERANETKTAFLANMSHEIRTPLGAILGFSSLLKDRSIEAQERDQYVDTIVRNGKSLTRIIDDILDLAKVEAGHLDIEEVPFSLFQLANDALNLFKDKTKEKKIFLSLNIDDEVPSQISSDPTRLRQILVNLIGNAVKFTDHGGVQVSVKSTLLDSRQTKITIDVKDSGIGLAPEQKEKLFTPFMQADNSMTRKFGGTGLGLALSQRLSRALEGEISIPESQLGQGSTFRLTFMAHVPKYEAKVESLSEGLAKTDLVLLEGLRVLVVDDSSDNQFLVARLLTKSGAKVDTALDGNEAFHKALKGSYDVILMDIQMPVMDGYQAKEALDNSGYLKPVIALTAHAMSDEREKTKAAGFASHLTKPLVASELLRTVGHLGRGLH